MVNQQSKQSQSSTATHRQFQSSTTLNRRYVRRPSRIQIQDGSSEPVVVKKAMKIAVSDDQPAPKQAQTAQPVAKIIKTECKTDQKLAAETKQSPQITRLQPVAPAKKTAAAPVAKTMPKVAQPSAPAKKSCAAQKELPAQPNPYQAALKRRSMAKPAVAKPSNKEIKEQAIKQALRSVATMEKREAQPAVELNPRKKSGALRFFLAFTCASACVVGIIAYVSNNVPDISVRVAAMQTGIEASYPAYVPRDYSLSNISAEEGKVTMLFVANDTASFTLTEEKSSWDSTALLRNFVELEWGSDYITTHEQGITIYINSQNSNAAWVNGGVLYKITAEGQNLTKKQVRNIVLSL